ncbi:hypothetical protein CSKR_101219 [Clonorchis sinensis]|uniref:GPR158/179 extracellular domain-containing protein n=1 Tax=Clonorchis sinensis TaxID=79923 RepID=A0A8T1MMN7_CLOSI|nr:hypothetical protein CSKR_101219 [Clonorchis sinensis]
MDINWLKVALIVCCSGVILPFVLPQEGSNPFRWFPPDNFDVISRKMDQANPENCATMSESDLRLPPTALSQLPRYNHILLQQWFTNRSKLLHLHNLALNRAFFYSYIYQRLDGPVVDPPFLPSLMYYYFSAAADVSAGPNVMNASAVLMDTNTTYANWYGLKVINHTLPLFGPIARRLDNWNDEMNFLRIPSNNTIEITDLGAGPNSNYTAPWYKNNPYIRDREMGINFIPDDRGTAPSKNQYTTKIQLADITGEPIKELETLKFYGPNAPGVKETFLPVRFTRPYYDCGASNRWIVSSVAALSDYMPRYSNITRLRGPRMVGIIVQSIDFYRIDFNPCPPGLGNPNHFLANIARCKPTTLCVPLPGFGFRRGGYECVCQPGHRLPAGQNGPFRGIDIEIATEEEYQNGFDCLPVGWREVIPEETGLKENTESRLVSSSVQSDYLDTLQGQRGTKGGTPLWGKVKRYARHLLNVLSPISGGAEPEVQTMFVPTTYGPDGLPEVIANPRQVESADYGPSNIKQVINLPLNGTVPGYRSLPHLLPFGLEDFNLTSPENTEISGVQNIIPATVVQDNFTAEQRRVSRKKRQRPAPFYTVGEGTVFNEDRFMEVQRLIAHAKRVTSKNCHTMTPDQLVFPGEVSYGAEKRFEMAGRTALRLAHFLSAYYQNSIVGEVYGSLITGFPLNRYELFGEVLSNVLSDFDIVSSGIFFDYQMFTDHDQVTWDLFAPYAYKPVGSTQAVEAIDMSIKRFRDYTEQPWFRTLKDRWASSRYGLERITTKPHIRSDVNGTQIQRYFNFPIYYRVPHYEDGYWTHPYFDCDGMVKDWLITYAAPFFGVLGEERALRFMGVTTISVRLMDLDINQCPQSFYTPNFFKNSARCDFRSTYCTHLPRRYFVSGSYKCECRQGFEYPINDYNWYFHGEMMEREYQLFLRGEPNRYELLKCRQGRGSRSSPARHAIQTIILLLTLYLVYF